MGEMGHFKPLLLTGLEEDYLERSLFWSSHMTHKAFCRGNFLKSIKIENFFHVNVLILYHGTFYGVKVGFGNYQWVILLFGLFNLCT